MALLIQEMDTANNKNAEAGTGLGTRRIGGVEVAIDQESPIREGDQEWLSLIKQAKSANESYQAGPKMRWAQAYRAYNNQHFSDSKYLSDRWRGRSKLHRPKTRNAVHKADARAAAALFTSEDVVQTTASSPADPANQASADILREILNYRLSRSSEKAGMPWFEIAVGAHNDARITGVCISKQYWERREVWTGQVEPIMRDPAPVLDEATGQPAIDPMTGQPIMGEPQQEMETGEDGQAVGKVRRIMEVVEDRPMVRLFPVEYCWRDPAANWVDQAQNSSYIALLHPMSIGDAHVMLNQGQNSKSSVEWRPLTKEQLAHCGQPTEVTGVQAARELQTTDRRDIKSAQDFNTCWLIEWFVRKDGREWHFWTGACAYLASEPMPVKEAYPAARGARPIVIGVAAIEPHKIDPISPVQAALPLQQEMNELVNLRLDGVKENVRPLTLVKAGSQLDANTLQNRSGDTVLYTKDPQTDVVFDRPAAIGGEAYTEMAHLNGDFDDTTGEFSGSSVTMNRQINETVGGMKLLNTAANIVGDFDLKVWTETWAEPVLRQIMKVIQYYEDDKTILTIAYDKAKLFKKYGVDQINDELLDREIIVKVDIGLGTADPAVALEKFAMAAKITGAILGERAQARAKEDPIINEIFGKAGFKGAAERFFHPGDTNEDPRLTKAKEIIGQLQAELEEEAAERANQIELARIKVAGDLLKQYLSNIAAAEQAEMQHEQGMEEKAVDQAHDTKKTKMAGDQKMAEIKAKPAPGAKGGKPTATAQKPEAEASPTGDDPIMKAVLLAMAQALAPQAGGPLTPAAGAAPGAPAQPQQPDPMQVIMAQMQQMQASAAQERQMMMAQMAQLSQAMAGMMQAQQMLAQVMAAPKTIIRDSAGRAQGMQIAPMNGAPATVQ